MKHGIICGKVCGKNLNAFGTQLGSKLNQSNSTLLDGLVSMWELQEESGTTVYDSTESYNGVNNNALINQTGHGNILKSYYFQGQAQLSNVVIANNIPILTKASFFVWEKLVNTGGIVFARYDYGAGKRCFSFDSALNLTLTDDGTFNTGHVRQLHPTTSFNTSVWHHIGFTFDEGVIVLYVNGVPVDQTVTLNNPITQIFGGDCPITIGSYLNNGVATNCTQSNINQAGIWDRAIAAEEVSELFNLGNGKPHSDFFFSVANYLLTEEGDYLLTEEGNKIIL